jgi:hypothetical protein
LSLETKFFEQTGEQEVSSINVSVINLSSNHYLSLENVSYHSNTNGPWTKETFIFNDMSIHVFRRMILTLGLLKQLEYEGLSVNFEAEKEQNVDLHYCRGMFVYTKSSIFEYISSFRAFNSSDPKYISSNYSPSFPTPVCGKQ